MVKLVLGGSWHDFARFAELTCSLLAERGVESDVVFDGRLVPGTASTLLLFTCFDEHTELDHRPEELLELRAWVRAGGGLVALHSSSVAAQRWPELARLLGGVFVSHPPKQHFRVTPSGESHPITNGVPAFELEDERYLLERDASTRVFLATEVDGVDCPLAWTRSEGAGRVVYLSLGHDHDAWRTPEFQALLASALAFAGRDGKAPADA